MSDLFETVFEDDDLLVINKPAGLVCHPTKTDEYSSLISRARLYLGKESRPQLINRLDRETSGVTLVAKRPEAARELRRLWEARQVTKEYRAIVRGRPAEAHGVIDAPLGKDEGSRVAIKDRMRPDGAAARTEYWVERLPPVSARASSGGNGGDGSAAQPGADAEAGASGDFSVLRAQPRTGRKHQIRIHLAHIGLPIVGDKLYGGDEDLYLALVEDRLTPEQRARLILPYHALHASEVRFEWRGREAVFRAAPEAWFTEFERTVLGGGKKLRIGN